MSDDEHIRQRRAELLDERKRELDGVVDRHDSMLRELFHLQKFLSFFGFDPQVAKQEKSEVWESFRKPFDLWENHVSPGPSVRRTRRAITERRESLIPGTASTSTPTPARKGKPPDVERALRRVSISNPNLDAAFDSPVAEHKEKGKGKAFAHPATPARLKKRPLPEEEGESRAPAPDEDEKLADGVAALSVSVTPGPTPRRRKQNHKRKPSPVPPETPPAPPSDSPSDSPTTTPLPKRIRLIVKPPPPPPIATHPAQLPRPRSFGGSLERLLSSFALLEEGDEDDLPEPPSRGQGQMIRPGEEKEAEKQRTVKIGMTWEEFTQSVQDEVEVWRQIEEMRRRGGLRCMRGWEIVRGEEDGEEEEEEAEGEEGAGGEGEVVNGGQEGEAEKGEDPEGGRILEAAEHAAIPLGELVASPRAMEIDATDLNPTTPGELAPSKTPGTSSTPEPTNVIERSSLNGVEHSAVGGAGSSPGLGGIGISLPGARQTPLESAEPSPAPLDKGEFTPGVEPAAAGPGLIHSTLVEPTSPAFLPGENDMVTEPTVEEPVPVNAAQADTSMSTPTEIPTIPLPFPAHPCLPPSLHTTLLDSIPSHARSVKGIPLAHRHRAATLVARYWERRQGAAERLIAAEERRVRAGAKALARGVVAKAWKDAVAVIRARLKEQEEAEQAREGRKHLAAILEQSSALLETQQEDMGRTRRPGGRSRSASSGGSSRIHRPDSDDEQAGAEEEEDKSDASGETQLEEGDGGDEGVEEGSEMLLDLGSRGVSEDGGDGEEVDVDVDVVGLGDGDGRKEEGGGAAVANALWDDAMSTTEDLVPLADFMFTVEPDAMSIVQESPVQSQSCTPRPDTLMADEDFELKDEVSIAATATRSPSVMDVGTNGHPDRVDVMCSPKTNGHSHDAHATPSTPLPVASGDASPSAPTPSGIRKLTLKFTAPEPPTADSPAPHRRSSRRTSVSTPAAGADDSDSEVDGLAKDAEMPLEELMRRYGYVGAGEAQGSTPAEEARSADDVTSARVADSDDEEEEGAGDDDMAAAEALLGPGATESQREGVVRKPFLLRGTLRPYQQGGLEWLVSGYTRQTNGILADEMGLGKTIQTISLLAHLACDRGIWGPHLIIVPTSVILNWEMEFKKFLPGFKVLSYYGSIKERKERRVGWNTEHSFNVVVTSYQLVLADQAIFRRKKWHYMILDEAHNIKNFKSQRWATLFSFNSERRLLLTGTPLQNNITELWSLLYFVQPDTANKQQFEEWFLETMRHAVETGDTMDEQTRDTIDKLHTVLRPYILRRLKADVERELPSKHEHVVYCRLSKRQRYLYDEFMSRAQTKETLAAGNFLSIVNCLMQLRKVCNHPDLFEVRPIVTSFTMPTGRSAVVDFEIKKFLVRRRLLRQFDDDGFSIWNHSFDITSNAAGSVIAAERRASLNASQLFPAIEIPGEPPPKDLRTIAGNKRWLEYQRKVELNQRHDQLAYVNTQRNNRIPILGVEKLAIVRSFVEPLLPADILEQQRPNPDTKFMAGRLIKSYAQREEAMGDVIDRFTFATPPVVALDVPRLTFGLGKLDPAPPSFREVSSAVLHRTSVKLQIAFPDASLLQYDCGKLQELDALLRSKHAGGHRVLIFTQMTRVLDILEIFLNLHGYRYLRLDGSTKIEQRQVVTERFNVDARIFAFIASSRSGGVGINLTGADTVIFYDSDYNPSMDRQCEDRAHRIGQTREVNIYRFISRHTVEESMLRKANQKRLLDDIVIQQGEFDWRQVLVDDVRMERALAEVEDRVDVDAARMAAGEEQRMDLDDFGGGGEVSNAPEVVNEREDEDDGLRPIERYMLRRVEEDWDYFC